jgi:hypothetical protein
MDLMYQSLMRRRAMEAAITILMRTTTLTGSKRTQPLNLIRHLLNTKAEIAPKMTLEQKLGIKTKFSIVLQNQDYLWRAKHRTIQISILD